MGVEGRGGFSRIEGGEMGGKGTSEEGIRGGERMG